MEYYNIKTGEVVPEDCAEAYAKAILGISIQPLGPDNTYTEEQKEFMHETIEWYFSGDWIKEEIEDEDLPNLERDLEIADRIYQDKLDKEWGLI